MWCQCLREEGQSHGGGELRKERGGVLVQRSEEEEWGMLNNDQQDSQTGVAYAPSQKYLPSLNEELSDKLHEPEIV